MLKVVVLPAPLGPMTPTISHSPARRLTSRAACTPPKRIEQSRTSSTDIAHPLPASRTGGLVGFPGAEPPAAEPTLQGTDLLSDPARMAGQREEQQHRPDHDRDVLLRQHLEPGNAEAVLEELVEEVPGEGEEGGGDHDAGAVTKAPDDRHDHKHHSQLDVEQVPDHESIVVGQTGAAEHGAQA